MFFDKLKSVIKTPEIEFLCRKEDFGVIPKPYPSRKLMPDWYKALPQFKENQRALGNEHSTLKRCPPFLDAMCVGWIIPLAADVEIKTNYDGSGVEYRWGYNKTMVESHKNWQVSADDSPNPNMPKPPLKWMNYWAIRVPPGYSVLFVPPLNRPEHRFTCLSGIVECDEYFAYINFPFFFNITNFTGVIEAGTPLMQAIPIKRDGIIKNGVVREWNNKDHKESEKIRKRYSAHNSIYRDFIWKRK